MNKFSYEGIVISTRPVVTKKGRPMCEVTLKTGAGAVTISAHGNLAERLTRAPPGTKVRLFGTFLLSAWELEIDEEKITYERPEKAPARNSEEVSA